MGAVIIAKQELLGSIHVLVAIGQARENSPKVHTFAEVKGGGILKGEPSLNKTDIDIIPSTAKGVGLDDSTAFKQSFHLDNIFVKVQRRPHAEAGLSGGDARVGDK